MAFGSLNTDTYNPNDLGIQFINNNSNVGVELEYNIYKPFWKLNNIFNSINVVYERMYNPDVFANFGISGNNRTTFSKQFFTCGLS